MAKGKVRLSNWSKPDLSNTQIKYAALDAYVSKTHDEFSGLLIYIFRLLINYMWF